jgi:hypothetical protein
MEAGGTCWFGYVARNIYGLGRQTCQHDKMPGSWVLALTSSSEYGIHTADVESFPFGIKLLDGPCQAETSIDGTVISSVTGSLL